MTGTEYQTRNGATINDRRTDAEREATIGYVVATDAFMSGWGGAANGRSLYAIAVSCAEEAHAVEDNMHNRSEMKRVRFSPALPRLRSGDHLSIAGKTDARRFFIPGGFPNERRRR
jgi:hypothetical protein